HLRAAGGGTAAAAGADPVAPAGGLASGGKAIRGSTARLRSIRILPLAGRLAPRRERGGGAIRPARRNEAGRGRLQRRRIPASPRVAQARHRPATARADRASAPRAALRLSEASGRAV